MAIDPKVRPTSMDEPTRDRVRQADHDRAQPGDVIGIENDGETTELGDTAEDEDDRRRDAEENVRDRR